MVSAEIDIKLSEIWESKFDYAHETKLRVQSVKKGTSYHKQELVFNVYGPNVFEPHVWRKLWYGSI